MLRSLVPVFGLSCLMFSVAVGAATPGASIARWIRLAEARDPQLKAFELRRTGALAAGRARAAFSAPEASYTYFWEPIRTRVGDQRQQVTLSQPITPTGVRRARHRTGERQADVATAHAGGRRWALRGDVATAWGQLFLLRRQIELAEENLAVLQRFEAIARGRYGLDQVQHPDVIRVQVEVGRMADRLAGLQARRPALSTDFLLLVGGTPGVAPWPTNLPSVVPSAYELDPADLLRSGAPTGDSPFEESPQLDIAAARIALADAQTAEVEREYGLRYRVDIGWHEIRDPGLATPDAGTDAFRTGVHLRLPTRRSVRAAYADAARQDADAERAAEQALRRRLRRQVADALFRLQDARRRVELHESTLIPKITESLRASVVAFGAGTGDFLELLDTERSLLEFQQQLAQARVDGMLAAIALEQATGRAWLRIPIEEAPQ